MQEGVPLVNSNMSLEPSCFSCFVTPHTQESEKVINEDLAQSLKILLLLTACLQSAPLKIIILGEFLSVVSKLFYINTFEKYILN